ncbi:Uncharacterized conserved protein YgbK, DUF1537 family [Cryobacterium psychrotolerans]|uniref:Uncharacterized conserved protein YgbK, DUF1537 family n=1 Tax=Cryobacterium psychrotolerans TaxID=386301 RepID=A0A1G9BXI6_9MICO|nr:MULTISPECIES: four-carbon acid sugar kinase family protein [Cryobacterium]TFD42931.1 four-carbon acid sugar kinase family protein [Cryobacterium sp. TMT1-2-1]TFD84110.1 four-carbon acid sugar kinase family protein [Cryobacterium psychrotolerans]SDK43675.1 Uncharacterized conserved protein YgbK, DUF1537 family [Cryobacterium psychrotolerans]
MSEARRQAAVAIGIAADDLTGAGDSAVQFARRGWRARLTLGTPSLDALLPGSVLAVVTDSRAQPDQAAREGTAAAVTALGRAGATRLFLKIDSTMRGSVAHQVLGALEAWEAHHPGAFAVVCPAYPAMGRTVAHGRVLVNGDGVEATAIGLDPVTPVTTSALSDLLPGSTAVAPGQGAVACVARITAVVASGARVVTLDASTDTELAEIAAAVAELGPRAVPVGSAGLAVAMAEVWAGATNDASPVDRPPGVDRVVVVVSSLHEVSRAQHSTMVESLPADQHRAFAPTLAEFLSPDCVDDWIGRELASAPGLPRVITITAPSERPGTEAGLSAGGTPSMAIAAGLATITAAVFDHGSVGALVLMGGEGARAVLDRLGADSVLVTDAIREGIPIGVVEGGRAHGLTVVTKAGGFGDVRSVADILPELVHPDSSAARVRGQLLNLGETP